MSMIPVTCDCGKRELVPDSFAGLQARCSSCGRLFMVPPQSIGSSTPPSAGVIAPPLAPPLTASAAVEPLTSPRTLGRISVLLGVGSLLLPVVLGIPALIVGGVSFLAIRRSNGLLPGKGLALTGMTLGAGTTALSLLALLILGVVALVGGLRAKSSEAASAVVSTLPASVPEQSPSAPDTWKVIFRSSDPSIWNDDVSKGPNHFAMSLDLAPDSLRYLRLTNVADKEYVIVAMTKSRLGQITDDGKYGWVGQNQFESNAHHLGLYHTIWSAGERGNIAVRGGEVTRGWGFGHIAFAAEGGQGFSWAGKPISKTVFEIAVKSESLTQTESKRLLKKGVVRE
jgi:hypothetical protein